ncbi:cation:proton antiporter [Halovivax sp.]|uniref:cation:proton antiporter n=1 Tax=Halovivax sp. TaxID=1935978 RepID=UPI0025BA70E9|nr:cation:proton antiporter [Halovivax sp.]
MGDFPPVLPLEDPIVIFGLAMLVFLAAPLVLQRARLPGIVGIILVGVAIGPEGLGILELDATFDLLGTIGLVYLMFVAGLEINLSQFIEYKDRSVVFGLASFVIPQVIGTVVGYYLLGLSLAAAVLFASIFASHTLLAYPVINRLGIVKNESVTATIGGTIITDTLALLVLAVVVAASVEGGIGPEFWLWLTVGLVLLFGGVWVIVPRIGRWFFRTVDQESYYEFLFVMAVLFVCAYAAEVAGVEHIVGAFLAGLVLNRQIPETGPLMNRIEFVGNALFIPFFLLWVGMHVDLRALTEGTDTLVIAGSLIVMVLVTKLAAAWLTGQVYDYSRDQTMTMFGLSVGQAAAALAIVLIGFEADLFDENMLNAVILMILVVSVISPAIVDRYGREVVRAETEAEYDPGEAPQRVMVPFSRNSHYQRQLLDLALIVRGASPEPLYTLTVAKPGADLETDAEIAEIEEALEGTEEYSAGAEVPVESQTRIDHNVGSGIVRAVRENRISTLVIGWDGAASRRQRVFGDVIDRVLTRTKQLVLVSHVREQISTTEEVVLILPRGIEHNDGFFEAVHTVERVSEGLGASIRALVVDADPERIERLFELVDPKVPAEFERVEGWKALLDVLRDDVDDDDELIVAMSARRGTMGWHDELRTLPKSISTLTEGNFLVVYPADAEKDDDRQFLQFK